MPTNNFVTEPSQSYAITPAEQSGALLPWRYTRAAWEPIDHQGRPWFVTAMVWLVIACAMGVTAISAWQYMPRAIEGQVRSVAAGQLYVQDGQEGPWNPAGEGRSVRRGARLRAEPGTVAEIAFDDGSLLRIESAGEWVVAAATSSLNTRVKRVRISHLSGSASYASAPRQRGVTGWLNVDMLDANLRLRGVANITADEGKPYTIGIWQGSGRLSGFGQRIDAQTGDLLSATSSDQALAIAPGAFTR